MKKLIRKILRKIRKLYLKPIEVFVFHKVSEEYNPDYGRKEDWTSTEIFKNNIKELQNKYEFISLDSALNHLKNDFFRKKKYAVLTCDDGYRMILNILPWLDENKIPITIFISTKYLDGISHDLWFDDLWKSKSIDEINKLLDNMYIKYSDLLSMNYVNTTIGLHGYGHDCVASMSKNEFKQYVELSRITLGDFNNFVSYYAYTWGKHSEISDIVLKELGMIPIYCDGMDNIKFDGVLHRKCIDNLII